MVEVDWLVEVLCDVLEVEVDSEVLVEELVLEVETLVDVLILVVVEVLVEDVELEVEVVVSAPRATPTNASLKYVVPTSKPGVYVPVDGIGYWSCCASQWEVSSAYFVNPLLAVSAV